MKSIFVTALILMIFTFISTPIISIHTMQENIIFSDNFESYVVESFPFTGGWELAFSGAGSNYQVVTDKYAYSGSKSLVLWGGDNLNGAWAKIMFNTGARYIGYEVAVLIENVESEAPAACAGPTFYNENEEYEGKIIGWSYALIGFDHHDKTIKGERGNTIGTWQPKTWFKIKVVLDRSTNTFDVWINDNQVGQDISTFGENSHAIGVFTLVSAWHMGKIYYDNVKIFSVAPEEEDGETETTGIPGFPFEAILIGLLSVTSFLFFRKRKSDININ